MIDGYAVATSTSYSMVNGDTSAGTNSKANVILTPTNYITGKATVRDSNLEGAYTDGTSTFSCTYKAKFVY